MITCKHCGGTKEENSQNKDHQFCTRVCYQTWRKETPRAKYIKDSIPTGTFPMFI